MSPNISWRASSSVVSLSACKWSRNDSSRAGACLKNAFTWSSGSDSEERVEGVSPRWEISGTLSDGTLRGSGADVEPREEWTGTGVTDKDFSVSLRRLAFSALRVFAGFPPLVSTGCAEGGRPKRGMLDALARGLNGTTGSL